MKLRWRFGDRFATYSPPRFLPRFGGFTPPRTRLPTSLVILPFPLRSSIYCLHIRLTGVEFSNAFWRAHFVKANQITQKRKEKPTLSRAGLPFSLPLFFLVLFGIFFLRRQYNFTLLAVGLFLVVGGIGNKNQTAVYEKMQFSVTADLKKGLEIRHVAMAEDCPIKDALRFLERGSYLVLDVYSKTGELLFTLPQNTLAERFSTALSPYQPLSAFMPSVSQEKNGKSKQKVNL